MNDLTPLPENPYAIAPEGRAKEYSEIQAPYRGPDEAARIALHAKSTVEEKHLFAQKLFRRRGAETGNKTIQKLLQIMERRHSTHENLVSIGYDNLRHLQGEGLTPAEIAKDLNMNQLDIMTYMSAHPEAKAHAQLDALACADAKIRDFLQDLELNKPLTKFDADRRQVEYRVLLEQVKRISAEWANYAKAEEENKTKSSTYHLNISMTQQTLPHHEDGNVRVIEHSEIEAQDVNEQLSAVMEESGLTAPGTDDPDHIDNQGPVKPIIPQQQVNYTATPSVDDEGYYVDPLTPSIAEPNFD